MRPPEKEPKVELPPKGDDEEKIFISGNIKKKQGSTLSKCESRRLDGRVFFKEQRVIESKRCNQKRRRDFILRF